MGAILGALATTAFNALSSREQYEQQHHMATHGYRHAAEDLQKAGLNRVLALGSPAPGSSGAGFQSADFGSISNSAKAVEQQVAVGRAQEKALETQADANVASAAKSRVDALSTLEMLPFNKQVASSNANAMDASASKTLVDARVSAADEFLKSLEGDKQQVLKSLYTEFGPMVIDLVRSVKEFFSSAKEVDSGFSLKSLFGSSVSGAREAEGRPMSSAEAENVAQQFVIAIEEKGMSRDILSRLSPQVRSKVFELRPSWRK